MRLAVELCLPDNAALEREAVRQRVAKLQDTLVVSGYYESNMPRRLFSKDSPGKLREFAGAGDTLYHGIFIIFA